MIQKVTLSELTVAETIRILRKTHIQLRIAFPHNSLSPFQGQTSFPGANQFTPKQSICRFFSYKPRLPLCPRRQSMQSLPSPNTALSLNVSAHALIL